MIKKVVYSNPQLESFINRQGYDSILIEQLIWRISKDSICEPFVIAKLSHLLPEAYVSPFPRFPIGFRPRSLFKPLYLMAN